MVRKQASSKVKSSSKKTKAPATARQCGLCGKRTGLTKTACCGNWICDDEDKYVLFSYAQNSCHRNHSRYTLCAYHHNESHTGPWQECEKCRGAFQAEIFVHYGTNEHNFEKLPNPPAFEPTVCADCGAVLDLAEGGYSIRAGKHYCEACTGEHMLRMTAERRPRPRST